MDSKVQVGAGKKERCRQIKVFVGFSGEQRETYYVVEWCCSSPPLSLDVAASPD